MFCYLITRSEANRWHNLSRRHHFCWQIVSFVATWHIHYVPSVVNSSAVMDLHRSRSCATLMQSLYDIFVHSLMLSIHSVLGLPCWLRMAHNDDDDTHTDIAHVVHGNMHGSCMFLVGFIQVAEVTGYTSGILHRSITTYINWPVSSCHERQVCIG